MRLFLPFHLFLLLVVATVSEEVHDEEYYRIEWDCYESNYDYERKESTFPSDFDAALDRADLYYPDDYLPFDEFFTEKVTTVNQTTTSTPEDDDDTPSRKVGIGGRRGRKRGGSSTKIGGGSGKNKKIWGGGSRKPDLRKPPGFNRIKTPGINTNHGGGYRNVGGGGFNTGSFGEIGKKTQKGNKYGGGLSGPGQKTPGSIGKGNKKWDPVQTGTRVRGGAGGFEKGPFTNRGSGGEKISTGPGRVKTPRGYGGNDNKPTRPGLGKLTGTSTKTGGSTNKKPGRITKGEKGTNREFEGRKPGPGSREKLTTPSSNGGRLPTTRFIGGTTPKGWTGQSTRGTGKSTTTRRPPIRSSSSSNKKITPPDRSGTTPSGLETTGSTPFRKGNRANRTSTKRPPRDQLDKDTAAETISTPRGHKNRNRTRTTSGGSTVSTPKRPGARGNRTKTMRTSTDDDTATVPAPAFTPSYSAAANEPAAPLPLPSITADAGQSASSSDEETAANYEEEATTRPPRRARAPERDCNEVFSEAEERGGFQKGSAIDNRFQQCKSLGSSVWDGMKRGAMKLFVKEGETPADAIERYVALGVGTAADIGKTWIQAKLNAPSVPIQTAEQAAAIRAKEVREAQEAALAAAAPPVQEQAPIQQPAVDEAPAESDPQDESPAEDAQQEEEAPAEEGSQEEGAEPAAEGAEEAQGDETPQEGDQSGDDSEAGEEQQEEGQGEASREENPDEGGEEGAEESPQDEGDGFPVQDVPDQDVPFQEIPEQEIPSQDYPTGYIS